MFNQESLLHVSLRRYTLILFVEKRNRAMVLSEVAIFWSVILHFCALNFSVKNPIIKDLRKLSFNLQVYGEEQLTNLGCLMLCIC